MSCKNPTHNLCVKDPNANAFRQIGVGWENSKGQIKLKLDAAVMLRWDDDLQITLFPKHDSKKG